MLGSGKKEKITQIIFAAINGAATRRVYKGLIHTLFIYSSIYLFIYLLPPYTTFKA